ncbi:hypothetical protein BDA96_06G254200 [Sorghum bicolor]|uniref:Cytochrome P450 n=2 Tax=Sorghum bicolor TaxID=4558 RepID=A0A921UD74_SORBI|nr:hypothetical protein BDA96_06G254200 [Sorghum bicolor]KXG27215.1 hypothetical protein SORBI_3006G232300 [Sorghum bicolor]
MAAVFSVFLTSLFVTVPCVIRLLYCLLWVPWRLQRRFRLQGIKGPPRRLLSGNAAEFRAMLEGAQSSPPLASFHHAGVLSRVVPHYHEWSARHGRPFVYWFGPRARLVVSDHDVVATVMTDSTEAFDKSGFGGGNPLARQLFGQGLPGLSGDKWARHRRVVAPAFNMERVKAWIPEIAAITSSMLDTWEVQGESRHTEFEVDVYQGFHTLSAYVISHVAFGSSYEEGNRIFELQQEQGKLVALAMRTVYIPGFRFVPTNKNRRRQSLNLELQNLLRKLIEINGRKCEDAKNLLGLMLSASKALSKFKMDIEEIIEECKVFYFGGKETTAHLLTWATLLLASNREWQDKARDEVHRVCGKFEHPNAENLSNLKIVDMVLKETLRLYPPVVAVNRTATRDIKLGKLDIPAGTQLEFPIIDIHRDTGVWGADADEFNPWRFADGHRRYHLGAYLPFGMGPSVCVGSMLHLATNISGTIAM